MNSSTGPPIRHVVFDLGGVLIDWDGVTPLVRLSEGRMSREQARTFWFRSKWVSRFETGRCTPFQFASGVVAELGIALPPDRFIEEFLSWNRGFFPGAKKLLAQLGRKYTLSCLTNNNELYIEALNRSDGLDRWFDHLFISCRTGLLKPAPEVFSHLVEYLEADPVEILFFDDNGECVSAARESGINAYCVSGVSAIETVLAEVEQ